MVGRESGRRGESAVPAFALRTRSRHERGAAVAEFAVMALVLWVLLAGMLELGRAYAAQQVLQNAASSAARDLSLQVLPADDRFSDARPRIFAPGFLVADADRLARCGPPPDPNFPPGLTLTNVRRYLEHQNAPTLNRLLLPLWIRDVVDGREVLRYPGAVLQRAGASGACPEGSVYTVRIPELRPDGGLAWRRVVERLPMRGGAPGSDSFSLDGGGWASLRVFYPFQAAGLQAWRTTPGGGQSMVDAVDPSATPPSGLSFVSTDESGVYGGRFGLGRLYSLGREVRPFRRVLAASAAFPREVFGPPGAGS